MGVVSRTETGPVLERRRVSWAAVFVLGVWAVMTGAAVWFVATYASNIGLLFAADFPACYP